MYPPWPPAGAVPGELRGPDGDRDPDPVPGADQPARPHPGRQHGHGQHSSAADILLQTYLLTWISINKPI